MNTERGPQSYLRFLRKQAGLTQRDLAYLIGYRCRTSISRLERGRGVPRTSELLSIELIFGVMAGAIFPALRRQEEAVLAERVNELKKADRPPTRTKEIAWASLRAVHLERVLESIRQQRALGVNVHEPWQTAARVSNN